MVDFNAVLQLLVFSLCYFKPWNEIHDAATGLSQASAMGACPGQSASSAKKKKKKKKKMRVGGYTEEVLKDLSYVDM